MPFFSKLKMLFFNILKNKQTNKQSLQKYTRKEWSLLFFSTQWPNFLLFSTAAHRHITEASAVGWEKLRAVCFKPSPVLLQCTLLTAQRRAAATEYPLPLSSLQRSPTFCPRTHLFKRKKAVTIKQNAAFSIGPYENMCQVYIYLLIYVKLKTFKKTPQDKRNHQA